MGIISELSFCLRTSCLLHLLTNNQNKGRSVWVFLKLLHLVSSNLKCGYNLLCCFPGSDKSEGSPVALQETSKPIQEESRELNKTGRPTVRCIPIALKYYLAILNFLSQYVQYTAIWTYFVTSFLSSICLKVLLVLFGCRCDLQTQF